MIDWVNAVLPFSHDRPIYGGVVYSEDEHGNTQWSSLKKAVVEGSHSSTLKIQTSNDHPMVDGKYTHIWVSGSPKPLQGHNLFGTSDPRVLAAHLARLGLRVREGIEVDPFTFRSWLSGRGVTFTMMDVTEMLDTGTETDAAQWIHSAQEHTRVKYRGRGEATHGTLYFGKKSRFWALKLYQKFPEVTSKKKAHKLPETILHRLALLEYARGTVRAELRFHSLFLKKFGLADASAWTPETARVLWEKQMQQLELFANRPLAGSDLESLPRALRASYALWREGRDMKSLLPKNTFYTHRRKLKCYGIDIALSAPTPGANVIPLLRTITAQPKGIPSWAINTPLLIAA